MEAAPESNGVSVAGGRGFAPEVPERFQQREAERREEAGRRRREKESLAVREEQSDYFAAAFGRERAAAEALLGPERDAEAVSEAAQRLQELQRLLTDSVRFLAPYEVRQAQAALGRLQDALAERRLQLQPKKRFAFKKGLRKEPASAQEAPPTPPVPSTREGQPSRAEEEEEEEEEPGCGFSRAEDQELELGPAELLQRDVALSQLSRCRVRLRGNPNTLLVRDCRDCTVLCGPVSTSVRVDGCDGCVLALACQQLRTHQATQSSFYVQVTCRAMLEDCSGVRFAPYTWTYEGIDADFETSGLDRSRDNWSQVDDFNWLARNEPSPNWSVIPENERIADWDRTGDCSPSAEGTR
ncbi:tubulin-specific chaperone C [Lacerta agilis]|uniref:tubulin-specific chaperone C n=1 Tax=Lacerta agilis TaxID=80427 RepID=UPI001419F33E|nr:tubulin-specific chaperone C [Lacerta agilis]